MAGAFDSRAVGSGAFGPSVDLARIKEEIERNRRMGANGELQSTDYFTNPQHPDRTWAAGPDPVAFLGDVATQPIRAGEAWGEAVIDPSLGNATNAGLQTAMTFMRPAAGLKILGAGYGAAAADDLGLFDIDEAQAGKKAPATEPIVDLPGLSPEQQAEYKSAVGRIRAGNYQNAADRRQLEGTVAAYREMTAKAAGAFMTGRQEEFDRKVKFAEEARDKELARNRRWSTSDSAIKDVFDSTGGAAGATVAAGGLAGGVGRLAHGGGTFAKNYVYPAIEGAVGGLVGANFPLLYDAYSTDIDNPEKAAYAAYAREHPDPATADKYRSYAETLPAINPIRKEARDEMWEPAGLGMRALEGGAAGVFGANIGQIGSRVKNWLLGGRTAPPGIGGPSGGQPRPPRGQRTQQGNANAGSRGSPRTAAGVAAGNTTTSSGNSVAASKPLAVAKTEMDKKLSTMLKQLEQGKAISGGKSPAPRVLKLEKRLEHLRRVNPGKTGAEIANDIRALKDSGLLKYSVPAVAGGAAASAFDDDVIE